MFILLGLIWTTLAMADNLLTYQQPSDLKDDKEFIDRLKEHEGYAGHPYKKEQRKILGPSEYGAYVGLGRKEAVEDAYKSAGVDKKLAGDLYGKEIVVGYGHMLQGNELKEYFTNPAKREYYNNLSKEKAEEQLKKDIMSHKADADALIVEKGVDPSKINPKQYRSLVELTFQLGKKKFGKFDNFWAYAKAGEWGEAAKELKYGKTRAEESNLYKQAKERTKKYMADISSTDEPQPPRQAIAPILAAKPSPTPTATPTQQMGTPGFSQTTEKQVAEKRRPPVKDWFKEGKQGAQESANFLGDAAKYLTGLFSDEERPASETPLVGFPSVDAPLLDPLGFDKDADAPVPTDTGKMHGPEEVDTEDEDEDLLTDTGKEEDTKKDDKKLTAEQQIDHLRTQIKGLHQRYGGNEQKFIEESKKIGSDVAKEMAKAQEVYRQSKDDIASRQLWESIINGIGYLAAGLIGKNTGLNLGGLKFSKQDWQAERDRILRELQSAQDQSMRKMSAGQRNLTEQRMAAAQDFRVNLNVFETALSSLEKQVATEARRKEKEDERLRVDAKIAEAALKRLKADQKKDYDVKHADFRRALRDFQEKDSEENYRKLSSAMVAANAAADTYGVPQVAPADLLGDDPKAYFFKNPDATLVTDRYNAFVGSKPTTGAGQPKDPKIEAYAKQHGISYEEGKRVIDLRRGNNG